MPKTKENSGCSDWSETGTFIRKPASGWLHSDTDMMDGSFVRYRLLYLGCLKVTQSMRTLQYNVRTLATKEAIYKMAEMSERIQPPKRRKAHKQALKLLGSVDQSLATDVNLCINVDNIQISNATSGRDMLNHSLTSISFASGGEGITQDFFGYVAKDPRFDRACHVFHCPEGTAQLVLASVGQAFELRFKLYLSSSPSHPTESERGFCAPAPQPRSLPSPPDSSNSDGVYYSDVYEPETSEYSVPSELPPSYETAASVGRLPLVPSPMTEISTGVQQLDRPRVYSDLPRFPAPESMWKQHSEDEDHQVQRQSRSSYNPYDTMPLEQLPEPPLPQPPPVAEDTEYQLITIHQQRSIDKEAHIDLTPVTEEHTYTNVDHAPTTLPPAASKPPTTLPPVASKPPRQRPGKLSNQPPASKSTSHDYDDPAILVSSPRGFNLPAPGDYDDPDAVMQASNVRRTPVGPPPPVRPKDISPAFDDNIYATPKAEPQEEQALDPQVPLHCQPYFHGRIPRPDAEGLLKTDGEFLVRESTNKPDQFVLTGLSKGRPQHLLLIDKAGKVKSRDREFESVPHLVKFFSDRAVPLVIGNCEVFLSHPVVVHLS